MESEEEMGDVSFAMLVALVESDADDADRSMTTSHCMQAMRYSDEETTQVARSELSLLIRECEYCISSELMGDEQVDPYSSTTPCKASN
ncbi:hypothetical protein PoB_002504700 [Plakobranchus ocellatus]|uniref:Uncharacterized protein n=1 Tax=Plakobranchus ocellatus TaxID=259542 RepID=A0AAV3ZVF4_9GAST|nr:hypothetical protein PoB_002504700 [Plakobranchus ocellatus]